MLKPEKREMELGRVLVQRMFPSAAWGPLPAAGSWPGRSIATAAPIIRDSRVIGDYPIESLKREKDDTREVREGMECGIRLSGFDDVKEADVLEVYKVEESPPERFDRLRISDDSFAT